MLLVKSLEYYLSYQIAFSDFLHELFPCSYDFVVQQVFSFFLFLFFVLPAWHLIRTHFPVRSLVVGLHEICIFGRASSRFISDKKSELLSRQNAISTLQHLLFRTSLKDRGGNCYQTIFDSTFTSLWDIVTPCLNTHLKNHWAVCVACEKSSVACLWCLKMSRNAHITVAQSNFHVSVVVLHEGSIKETEEKFFFLLQKG